MESEQENAPESVKGTEDSQGESSAEVDKTIVGGESGAEESSKEKKVEGVTAEGTSAVTLERTDSVSSAEGGSIRTPALGKDKDKINILLKPVGDAPILKNKLWAVPSDRLVSQITEFVKKYLKLEKHQNLFFFVNQLFAPAPDQCLRDLYECFGSDGKLVLHYSTTVAWG